MDGNKKQETRDGKVQIKEFTDLMAWQEAHKLVLVIYKLSEVFPKSETFGLISQIRRAAISITSNIAEGYGRQTYKEKLRFYFYAHSSLLEIKNQLFIARDLKYLGRCKYSKIYAQLDLSQRVLQGLITKTKQFAK